LVDDEEQLISALAERLSLRGLEAQWASTCDDALRLADEEDFEVAVLDVKMPKMCGIELKRVLQEKCPHMKFIFVTGHGSEDDYRKGLEEGGEAYCLVKPLNIEVLVQRIDEITQT
jgi:DNA-binding response OmpR family regulator